MQPIRLTPNQRPAHPKALPARETSTPLPLPAHPPPDHAPPPDDNFIPSARIPAGSTDASDNDSGDDHSYQIPGFEASNSWLHDYHWAAQDPSRAKTASELPSSHKWDIVDTLSKQDRRDLKDFQDAMYKALAKVHTTSNGSKLRIKVPQHIVDNISKCFARARLLKPDLARRTESFFLDWPNHLLTVAVPTDFDLKDAWARQGNSKYAFYHKTDCPTSPRSSLSALYAPQIGPKTAKGCPNNFPAMAPSGWPVKSTQHGHHWVPMLLPNSQTAYSKSGKAN